MKRGFVVPEGHGFQQAGQRRRGADPLQLERIAGADAEAGRKFWYPSRSGSRPGGPALCWVLGPVGAAVGRLSWPLEAWGNGEFWATPGLRQKTGWQWKRKAKSWGDACTKQEIEKGKKQRG